MDEELMHELSAAYALDALGADEERAYERHLARCERCQEEVAAFTETAAAVAYAAAPSERPDGLRERILVAARGERGQVVTLRPRWAYPAVAAASVAACAAIGLGVWAATLHSRLPGNTGALQALPLSGAHGSVVVTGDGAAALVVSGLPPAPTGRTYEVWVLRGTRAEPAGLFAARTATSTIRLTRRLGTGERVGVTLEPAGGSTRPTTAPLFTSTPA